MWGHIVSQHSSIFPVRCTVRVISTPDELGKPRACLLTLASRRSILSSLHIKLLRPFAPETREPSPRQYGPLLYFEPRTHSPNPVFRQLACACHSAQFIPDAVNCFTANCTAEEKTEGQAQLMVACKEVGEFSYVCLKPAQPPTPRRHVHRHFRFATDRRTLYDYIHNVWCV